jgi:hypothetical protein
MKKYKAQIFSALAVLNSVLIGLFAFLTVFMFKNNVSDVDDVSGCIIALGLFISVFTKVISRSRLGLIISLTCDLVLIGFLYNPTEYISFKDFINSLFDLEVHCVVFVYLFLIYFYWDSFRNVANR